MRALEQMRSQRFGQQRGRSALAPLVAVAALVVLALIGLVAWPRGPARPELHPLPRSSAAEPTHARSDEARAFSAPRREPNAASEVTPERAPPAPALEPAGEPEPSSEALTRTQGRVLDVRGVGQSGLAIVSEQKPDETLAISGEGGLFSLERRGGGCLRAEDEAFTTVLEACTPGEDVLILVAPLIELSGVVVDENGRGLEGAALWWYASLETLGQLTPLAAGADSAVLWRKTDEAGRFSFERLPAGPDSFLRVSKDGFEERHLPLPESSTETWRVALETSRTTSVIGSVLHATGRPASGAAVALGTRWKTQADGSGQFSLAHARIDEGEPLVATLPGFGAAILPAYGAALGAGTLPTPLVLTLGPACAQLGGRLTTEAGEGLAGWQVRLFGGTSLSPFYPLELAEDAVSALPSRATTDEAGSFRLGGLAPEHEYRIRVSDPVTGVLLVRGPFRAGAEDLRILVPSDALRPTLAGRALSLDGQPLAGVRLTPSVGGLEQGLYSTEALSSVHSGSDGRFLLPRIPRYHLYLEASGEDIERCLSEVDARAESVELRLTRLCRVRVDASRDSPDDGGRIEFRSADGQQLLIYTAGGFNGPSVELQAGRSAWIRVAETATSCSLLRDGELVKRFDLAALTPAQPREIVLE